MSYRTIARGVSGIDVAFSSMLQVHVPETSFTTTLPLAILVIGHWYTESRNRRIWLINT
jgi:hypothetical protein